MKRKSQENLRCQHLGTGYWSALIYLKEQVGRGGMLWYIDIFTWFNQGYGNCQIHISHVYPHIDPVLHILFLNNCQVFLEIEFTQVGYFSTPLCLSFRSRPRSSSQFASAAALWLDFSRYHCPCFCWTLNLDKINIPFQSRAVWSTLPSACAGFTVVCNGRFFTWHIPSQNRALMPRWQWGMPVNFQPDQTYFSKPG